MARQADEAREADRLGVHDVTIEPSRAEELLDYGDLWWVDLRDSATLLAEGMPAVVGALGAPPIYVCADGRASAERALEDRRRGDVAWSLAGGVQAWRRAGLPWTDVS
ncbi:MAG: hypothetical protein RLZZ383_1146 [Pseudomonadota bacterium]